MEHGTGVLVEQVPAGMLRVIVHILLAVRHLAGRPVVIHPFAAIGSDILHTFGHSAGCLVKIIPAAISVILALDHMAIGIVPNPFTTIGTLINIFVACHCSICVEPVPGITARIVDFL